MNFESKSESKENENPFSNFSMKFNTKGSSSSSINFHPRPISKLPSNPTSKKRRKSVEDEENGKVVELPDENEMLEKWHRYVEVLEREQGGVEIKFYLISKYD